jgi:hypothetical protein
LRGVAEIDRMAKPLENLDRELQELVKTWTDPLPFLTAAGFFLHKAAEKLNPKSATGFLVNDAKDTVERVVEELHQRRKG